MDVDIKTDVLFLVCHWNLMLFSWINTFSKNNQSFGFAVVMFSSLWSPAFFQTNRKNKHISYLSLLPINSPMSVSNQANPQCNPQNSDEHVTSPNN